MSEKNPAYSVAHYWQGVEQATEIYKQVIRQYVAENAKLRELVDELYPLADNGAGDASELDTAHDLMREVGIDPDEIWGEK